MDLEAFAAYRDISGRVTRLPSKLSRRDALSLALLELFEPGTEYSEPQLNQMLKVYLDDFALVRRTLVEMGQLERDPYGRVYERVVKTSAPS